MHQSFGGWYYRIQSDTDTLAVIPAYHQTEDHPFCSVQMITKDQSWSVPFPWEAFRKNGDSMQIGPNYFGAHIIHLELKSGDLTAKGELRFGPLTPIKYDIMGPFRYVPFMECRHTIRSMRHTVSGSLEINGKIRSFQNALGYLEGDRGRSFPKHYVWTQCFFPGGSLVLSAAEIPMGPLGFTGTLAVVMWQGKEYRLATYLGAKVVHIGSGEVILRQGPWTLSAKLLARSGRPLLAPVHGDMVRTIHEHVICRAAYCFQNREQTLFQFTSDRAAFEYEYPV